MVQPLLVLPDGSGYPMGTSASIAGDLALAYLVVFLVNLAPALMPHAERTG